MLGLGYGRWQGVMFIRLQRLGCSLSRVRLRALCLFGALEVRLKGLRLGSAGLRKNNGGLG